MDINDFTAIDFGKLRKDLEEQYLAAYLAGGFGSALIQIDEVKQATDDELVSMAKRAGIKINRYFK